MKMNIGIPLSGFWDLFRKKTEVCICRYCAGSGKINNKKCPMCDGRGWNIK